MRNQQQTAAPRAHLAREQAHELLGERRIECAGRLIGDDQLRSRCERLRDRHALPLAAGELVGIAPRRAFWLRNAHPRQPLDHLLPGGLSR